MGEVYAATHITLRTSVAIKFLRGFLDEKVEARQRFVREAQVAASLESDHIVRVFDVGEHADVGVFVVMERLRGCDLGQALTLRERLPATAVISYAMQVCSALAEAHRRGVIHRDIKPANLFLVGGQAGDGAVLKVLDFGLSKQTSDAEWSELGLTHSRNLLGSPLYVAPEQASNARSADARADIWSLGVVMHQALVGTVPFTGTSVMEVLAQISAPGPVPSLRKLRSEIPADLDAVVLRCLAKDREQRWPDIAALASALAACAAAPETATVMAQRIAALGRDPNAGATTPGAALAVSGEATTRRTPGWLALSAVCTLAVVGGGLWWWQRDAHAPVTAPPSMAPSAADSAVEQHQNTALGNRGIDVDAADLGRPTPGGESSATTAIMGGLVNDAAGRQVRELDSGASLFATARRTGREAGARISIGMNGEAEAGAVPNGGASGAGALPVRTPTAERAVRTVVGESSASSTSRVASAPSVAPVRVAVPSGSGGVAPSGSGGVAPSGSGGVAPSGSGGVAPSPFDSTSTVDPLGERK